MFKQLRRILQHHTTDLILFAGAAALCYGLWQIYPPLAWIAGGAGLIGLALLLSQSENESA